jgi:hypothetical protein
MIPLSRKQKVVLVSLAREAWIKQGQSREFDAWRREQVRAACGRYGLTEAGNDDFLPIKRHFLSLTDRAAEEFETALREDGEMRRRHLHNLKVALGEDGLTQGYAESISRNKFGYGTKDCTDAQLLQLVMTVRARVAQKARKEVA